MFPTPVTPLQNRLLEALPSHVQRRLFPRLELVKLRAGKVLNDAGGRGRGIYFPADCIVSLLNVTESGASAETSLVGNEGFVGIALLMGGDSMPSVELVQSPGHAWRLPAAALDEEIRRHGDLLVLMLRYTQTLIAQTALTIACNRHHTIHQQLCRLLLLSLDRLPGNTLAMTQRDIAEMIGVRREGINEAAGRLQDEGAISYARGEITVLDRPLLEKLSCECYAVVKRETDRLLPRKVFRN